jgi:hypothetical protein
MERAMDPLYDLREELPQHEFDAVDYFVREPGRAPAPPPTVLAHLDSNLSQPDLADRLDRIVADMTEVLFRTTPLRMRLRNVSWVNRDGQGGGRSGWPGESREDFAAALRAGRVDLASVMFTAGNEDQHRWYFQVQSHPWPEKEPDAALRLTLSSMDLWPADATDAVAAELLDLVVSWAGPFDLRTAAITYDRGGGGVVGQSPYECWYGINTFESTPITRERVRGYYWANLLTAGHLERLGGEDALRNRAAPYGFLMEPAGPAVVLRAPGPITAFDDDRLAAMREVLRPALPSKPYSCYQGYPLRIVPDPGTAFRRVPPGSPFPRVLPGTGPAPDAPVP